MNKISVGAIVAQSYRFAFGNFLRVLGIIWLPMALEFAGLFLIAVPYFHAMAALFANLPHAGDSNGLPPAFVEQMQSLTGYAMLLFIAGLFLRAVMMLGVAREALGLRTGLPFVYFAIGKDVWRLFGAYFIFYVLLQIAIFAIVFVVAIPSVIVGVIAAVVVGGHLDHVATAALVGLGIAIMVLLIYGGMFYFMLRMGFLLTPVVVVEKTVDIARFWNLSKGNVWRMFLVSVAIFLPAVIVYMLVLIGLLLHAAWPVFSTMPTGNNIPPEVVHAHLTAFFHALSSEWILLVPLAVIFATVMYGLVGGATAFSYRALVPSSKPAEAPLQTT